MKTKLLTLLVALIATSAMWASKVITYTATSKLSETTDQYTYGLHTNAFNVAISSHTFSNGTGTITFAGEVTTIGEGAFYYCSSLTSVTIPNSVTTIGDYAFYVCGNLIAINVDAANTHYTSVDGILFNYAKDTLIQYPVGNTRTAYTIPNSVTAIEDYAFMYCNSLTSVTIPNSVTSIGYNAFYWCSGLTSAVYNAHCFAYMPTSYQGGYTIPDGITQIAGGAFEDCSKLTSIIIPNSVTTIGEAAFYGCSGLTSPVYNAHCFAYMPKSYQGAYTIPSGIKQIAGYAFYNCSGLTSITIPNSVTTIGDNAFELCSGLTKTNYTGTIVDWCQIKFGDFLSNPMGYSHNFYINDVEVKDLVIPDGVGAIGDCAFYGCSGLISVTIPNSVRTIGEGAFYGCSGLTSVTIGNSVTTIGDYAFNGCRGLTSIRCHTITPPTCGTWCFSNVPTSIPVYVPARSIDAYKKADEWRKFTNIQRFPEDYAMITCLASNGTIKGGGKLIKGDTCTLEVTPNYGYYFIRWSDGNTDNPRSFVITQDSTFTAQIDVAQSGQCGDNLYWKLVSDTLIIIGSGKMYDYTESHLAEWYLSNRKIAQLVLPDSLTHIGNYAFANCSGVTSVNIPNSVTTIGNSAFEGCSGIKSVTWNAKNCSGYNFGSQVETFIFGDSVEIIPANVCQDMAQLTTITIPNSATTIRSSAFSGCNGLATITIPSSVQSVGNSAFKNCTGISEMNINDGLTAIGDYAFYGLSNKNLKEISLPNSVETIGKYAFAECSYLKTITLGAKLEDVDEYAFQNDERLLYVNCYAEEPPVLQENAFNNYDIYLQVPCEVLDEYKVAKGWKLFNRENVSCLSAEGKTVTGDDVTVAPSANDATFTWPANDQADSYSLEITKDGVVFCTLKFNATGQLTGIAFAPGRGHTAMAHAATSTNAGWQFTVTGLNQASKYAYTMDVKNASQKSIKTYTGEFVTDGYTDLLPLLYEDNSRPFEGRAREGSSKFIQNGHLLIERNGILYNAHGARVK